MQKRYTGYRTSKKLSSDDARQIRELYATGEYTQKQLAQRFGVRQQTISHIVCRNSHVAI
ncbi:MAG: hypothetical protein ACYTF1_13790 [Planctomycetota bacterium]|jgi:DNA-binding XRE family transcriptional regulator